ncbi:hypothetical protein [Sporosarcina luteola]|nr:hypothetical protein [Sporosarcina luteola]
MSKGVIVIKKVLAILLAVSVVACSATIFAAVEPAVELLASFEKEYEQHLHDAESFERLENGLNKAELDLLELAADDTGLTLKTVNKRLDGQAGK